MLQGSWKGGGSLAGYQQQDAHEYLQFILNNLHSASFEEEEKEAKAEECPCVIHQVFCGIMRSTVQCSKCKNTNSAFDPFIDLSLDVKSTAPKKKKAKEANGSLAPPQGPQTIELSECFDRFTSHEQLQAADYTCKQCDGPQNAVKRLSLSRLPTVLPIHLKRFSHSKSLATSVKLDTKVHFPVMLDLQPYTSRMKTKKGDKNKVAAANGAGGGGDDDEAPAPSRPVYELSSVIVHKGKMDSGHYVCYAREGDEWFSFDDSKVVLVEEKEVLSAEAYMLFYVIRDID
jgi:ubiquitin carboxyl-terminal hydrolase 22/27/51